MSKGERAEVQAEKVNGSSGPTLADRMLEGHERTFKVLFCGDYYPLWKLVESLAYIQDKNGNNVPFRYNYQQCLLYLELCRCKESGRQPRIDILKARQIGFSTMIAVQSAIIAFFTPNTSVGIIADTEEHASGLFEKVRYVYDHLDLNHPYRKLIEEDPNTYGKLSYKPTLKYCQGKKLLHTKDGNSKVEVLCVSDSAGRSKTYTILHCSEVAFWKITEKALLSLFKTVSRTNPNSMIYLETTANGFNDYKLRWDRDYAGDGSSFTSFFAPWFQNPEYKLPVPVGYDLMANLDSWEIEKMKKHGLSLEQMYWFHLEYLDSGRGEAGKAAVLQEDPFDPIDAFVSSGSSVFDKEFVERRKREIAAEWRDNPPETGIFTCKHLANEDQSVLEVPEGSIEWHVSKEGPIAIFEKPDPRHHYVACCDPFMGGSDNVAIQVVDNCNGRQVARFKSNELSNDKCAWQLYCLARMYNWALVTVEVNVGQIVLELIVKANYPNIYVSQAKSYESAVQRIASKFGHRTTKANRQFMIDSLTQAFMEDPEMIRDYDTICEMETFQIVEKVSKDGSVTTAKQEAAGSAHDDLVMALAAFYLVRTQQKAVPTDEARIALDPFEKYRLAAKENAKRKMKGDPFGMAW